MSLRKKNKQTLNEIRNYCGAHRDKNGYKKLALINSIESNDMLYLASEFMITVSNLTLYFSRVMKSIT